MKRKQTSLFYGAFFHNCFGCLNMWKLRWIHPRIWMGSFGRSVGWLSLNGWVLKATNPSFPWDVRFLSQTYIDKCELADVWVDKHEWVLGKIIRWCCSCWDFGVNIRVKLSYHQLMSRFTSTCYCCCYAFAGCHWFKKQWRRVNRLPFVRVEVWKFNRFGKVILSNVSFTFEIF